METIVQIKDGVFVVSISERCPLYVVGDEFVLAGGVLSLPAGKSTCMILAQDLIKITSSADTYDRRLSGHGGQAVFQCTGCQGSIRFGPRKSRSYQTGQMQLLADAESRRKRGELRKYFTILRQVEVFSPLTGEELMEMASILHFEEYSGQSVIVRKGTPGSRLMILLSGKAEVVGEQGIVLDEMGQGEVIGEMSLLSGNKVSQTVVAVAPCHVGIMEKEDFKSFLNRYPALRDYFYKLLVSRINEGNRRHSVALAIGMVGQLTDIALVDLCQLINNSQKTGRLTLDFERNRGGMSRGVMLFHEGELVCAEIGVLKSEQAFYTMLGEKSGRFRFHPELSLREKRLRPIGRFMALIMQGMQYLDDNPSD